MRQIIKKNDKIEEIFNNRAIVVNGHCNEFYKKVMLIELLERIRSKFKDAVVLYASHLPIDVEIYDFVDYVIFNKNNPIFNKEINTKFSRHVWWWNTYTYRGEKNLRLMRNSFYHGYAHHILLNDATSVVKNQKIEYVHYVNYDTRLDVLDTLDEHFNYMTNDDYDLVSYQYFEDGIGTEFFSAKTDVAYNRICPVLSLQDYEKFQQKSLEQLYKKMFEGVKHKNLGYFKPNNNFEGDNINVGRLKFDFRENLNNVIPLNSNIDGVIIIPYIYDNIRKINVSNSNNTAINIVVNQYNYDKELTWTDFIPLGPNQWNEFLPRPESKYVKILFDGKEKTYFDLDDRHNYGSFQYF